MSEIAALLRVERADIEHLLGQGRLAGYKVAGEWRIPATAVAEYINREMNAARQEGFERAIRDPRTWARDLRRMPEMAAQYREREFEEGTWGAWVKEALLADERERAGENVVPLDPRRD